MPARLTFALLALCGPPEAAHAFGDCASPAYRAAFSHADAETGCEWRSLDNLVVNGSTSEVRILRLGDTFHGGDESSIAEVNALLDDVAFAAEAMGPGLRFPPSVSILLEDGLGTGELADAEGVADNDFPGECAVTLYKPAEARLVRDLTHLLAHELFHCAQMATWPAGFDRISASWWIEGSAEYFATLVVPLEGGYARDFGPLSHATSLYADPLDYETEVFFDWLHQTGGGESVAAALGELDRSSDGAEALRRFLPIDLWVRFVEDFAAGRIRQPHGRPVPPGEPQAYIVVEGDSHTSAPLATGPYRVFRVGVEFPEPGIFELALEGPAGLRVGYLADTGEWQPLPREIDACRATSPGLLYAVTTEEGGEFSISYRRSGECSPCTSAGEVDACLTGSWVLTAGGPLEWARARGLPDHIQAQMSEMSMSFSSDGTYMMNPVSAEAQIVEPGADLTAEGVSTGFTGDWSVREGKLMLCPREGSTTTTTRSGGQETRLMWGPGGEVTLPYSCSGNRLETAMPIPNLPPIESTFTRR